MNSYRLPQSSPSRLLRLAFRITILLYKLHLDRILGNRFLMLTHIGRKFGQKRQTALEVALYDQETASFVVAAGFGQNSDWYYNIQANPKVTIQFGNSMGIGCQVPQP